MGNFKVMVNIDAIMDLLDWNRSIEEQSIGLEMAREVKCINVFIQPGYPYGKNVWDNCAKIISQKKDEELSYYLIELLEWVQDVNWPGALCIRDRLKKFKDKVCLHKAINICKNKALLNDDEEWIHNLNSISAL